MSENILEVRGLRTAFHTEAGAWLAVDGVDLTVRRGEIVGLVGESGSGKSVTGFSLLGLIDPPGEVVDGEVKFKGTDLRKLSEEQMRQLRGNRIAMIFQDPLMTLNPVLRIGEQMMEAILTHEDVPRAEAEERCREALAMVGIPSPEKRLKSYPHEFSGGMRQRVAIAIAMLNKPDLIICDEPTTALDVTIQGQILYRMQEICREHNTALIWITHDLGVVAELADRVAVMYAGRIVESGPVEEVLDAPPIGLSVPPALHQRGHALHRTSPHCHHRRRAQLPLLRADYPRGPAGMSQADTPVIELKNVHKRFEQRPDLAQRILALTGRPIDRRTVYAVNGVDLSIKRGEVVGLVGESGCGKSTLGRVVAGLHGQTEGQLLYQGQEARRLRGADKLAYTLGVQMIFQDPQASLNPRQRLRQILGESLKVHKLAPAAQIPARIDQALKEVGLDPEYRDRFPHQISGGQRQRIGIARALMVAPKFLVCDEPVAALDVSIQAQVINLFMDLREQHGFTYLFISHDLGVVKHISDRVAIMYLGKIVEISTSAEIFARANHPYTQALMAEVPDVGRRGRKFTPIKGEIPSPLNPPPGCTFNPRCPHAMPRCREQPPVLKEISAGHWSACHLNEANA